MSDTRDWNAEAIDDLGTEVARLEADRDQWKARAEAAEFAWKDPATMHLNLLRTGILTREQALHLAGATDYDALKARAKAAEARVKHLEDVLKARDLEEDDWSEEAEVQEARIAELEASEEALQQKLDTLLAGGETCGCSYDRPGDYCMHHSPALMQARARIADLEARLARVPDREAVARALCDVTHAGADFGMATDDVLDDPRGREYWFRLADAAIAALAASARVPDREAVARAIYDELEGPIANQDFMRQTRQWEKAQRLADIAIAAMQETKP